MAMQTIATAGAICLGPSRNLLGGYDFVKLSSGKLILRNQFYPRPIAEDVTSRALEIGEIQKGPRGLWFKNKRREISEHHADDDDDIAGANPVNIAGANDDNQNDNASNETTYQDMINNNCNNDDRNEYEIEDENIEIINKTIKDM